MKISHIFNWRYKKHIFIFFIFSFFIHLQAQDKSKSKIKLRGSANAQVRYYAITKGKTTRPPFVANINAQPVLEVGKWTINSRFVIGNYQTQFRDFNRYGISPQYKWVKLYIGHNTLNWSQFALESRPILGAGFDLTPGKLHFGFFAGNINRAAVQDTFRNRVFSPTFLRQMIAVKLGYGTATNFIDLMVLKAADKASSLTVKQANGITPASNAVLALKVGKELIKNLNFTGDIAYSAFTNNTSGKGNELAGSTPAKIPGNLIKTNSTTQLLGAYAAGLNYNKRFKKTISAGGVSLDYSRIEPNYQSMGLYFLVNDIERIKLGLMLQSKSQKLQFNGNAGYEHNDVLNTQFYKNKRIIEGVNIIYRPNNSWNWVAAVQNYAVRLLVDGITANDSLLINQVNRNYSLSASGLLGDKTKKPNERNRIMASVGYQSGKNIIASTTTRNLGHTYFQINYMPALADGRWKLSPGYSFHRYTFVKVVTTRHIPTVAFDRSWKNNTYYVHFETGLILTWFQKKFNTFGWRNSLSAQWNINPKNYFQLGAFVQPNQQKGNNFMEIQVDLRYGVRF